MAKPRLLSSPLPPFLFSSSFVLGSLWEAQKIKRKNERGRGGGGGRGKRYRVMSSSKDYSETGIASWYGTKFHGRLTSNREIYNIYAMTAAHKSLPLPPVRDSEPPVDLSIVPALICPSLPNPPATRTAWS